MKVELTELSKGELELIKQYADQHELTIEQAASELLRDGLAKRVRRSTGIGPARNVLKMPRG
jgi:hypothetical protein